MNDQTLNRQVTNQQYWNQLLFTCMQLRLALKLSWAEFFTFSKIRPVLMQHATTFSDMFLIAEAFGMSYERFSEFSRSLHYSKENNARHLDERVFAFGAMLKRQREELKMPIEYASAMSGFSIAVIENIENGTAVECMNTLCRYCVAIWSPEVYEMWVSNTLGKDAFIFPDESSMNDLE